MTREDKNNLIDQIAQTLSDNNIVYLADATGIDALTANDFRRNCFKKQIGVQVVKNTLLKKAMDKTEGKEYGELADILKGQTILMTAEAGNAPAKLIKEYRKKTDKILLKGAYVEESIYIGDDKIEALSNLKSKNELIADVIALLQSPAKNVISALKSNAGDKIAGLVKTLQEKES